MRRMATALALVIAALAIASSAQSKTWHLGQWDPGVHNVQNAVYFSFCHHRYVTCPLGDEAWRVVGCETGYTYSTWAENGQYKNVFQMGTSERRKYGWHDVGSSPWIAGEAAHNYYTAEVAAGQWGWHPWECKP